MLLVAVGVWLSSHPAVAENLFVSEWVYGRIYEIAPDGSQSMFASGLGLCPADLAF